MIQIILYVCFKNQRLSLTWAFRKRLWAVWLYVSLSLNAYRMLNLRVMMIRMVTHRRGAGSHCIVYPLSRLFTIVVIVVVHWRYNYNHIASVVLRWKRTCVTNILRWNWTKKRNTRSSNDDLILWEYLKNSFFFLSIP